MSSWLGLTRMHRCLLRRNMNRRKGKGEWSLSSPDDRVPATTHTSQKTLPTRLRCSSLVDGNDFPSYKACRWRGSLKGCHRSLTTSPYASPGKVAVVGFSLGGGFTLTNATRMPELVCAVVVYYPFTSHITNPDNFVSKITVPTLMFAGGRDTHKNCCLIETARKLADAAKKSEGKVILKSSSIPMPSMALS